MPDHAEEIMQGFGKKYFEEGVTVGEARSKARAQGITEGYAEMLLRLLEKRVGAVPPALRARIFAADLASIERWFDRAIEATDLESVFDTN